MLAVSPSSRAQRAVSGALLPSSLPSALYQPYLRRSPELILSDRLGLKLALADLEGEKLTAAGKDIAAIVGEANVLVCPTDVSKLDQVVALRDRVYELWDEVRTVVPL